MDKRVTVGVRAPAHQELVELADLTGQKVSTLVDRAIKMFLEVEAPVWRRAAAEASGAKEQRMTRRR